MIAAAYAPQMTAPGRSKHRGHKVLLAGRQAGRQAGRTINNKYETINNII